MDLKILSFDKFKSFAQRNKETISEELEVDTAPFMSRGVFSQVPFCIVEDKWGWVGSERRLYLPPFTNVMSLLHESFHYFLCPKERLGFNDFGLGLGSESFGIGDCKVIDRANRDLEEEAVCYLTISMAKKLRIPTGAIMHEMRYAELADFFIKDKDGSRDEFEKSLSLIKEREIERFGINPVFPLF